MNSFYNAVSDVRSANYPKSFVNNLLAVCCGNMLEWYDFAIFGAFADILGHHFFSGNDPTTDLLQALAVFGSAFLMRPIGGLLLGYIGDKYGRKVALEISVGMIMLPSFLIGVLPTRATLGPTAALFLVCLRLMQGLAVGGEMVGAIVYSMESTGGYHRGFWGAMIKASGLVGTFIGLFFSAVLRETLTTDQLYSYGWRIPFWSSLVIGCVGVYLRAYLEESQEYLDMKQKMSKSSTSGEAEIPEEGVWAVLRNQWRPLTVVIGAVAFWCVGYYGCFVWASYYMGGELTPLVFVNHAWTVSMGMLGLLILLFPLGGVVGDIVGHQQVLILACKIAVLLVFPAFLLISFSMIASAVTGLALMAISLCMYGSNLPAFMVDQFPVKHRFLCVGVAYNVANAIFSGTAPLILSQLVVTDKLNFLGTTSLGLALRPAIYIAIVAILSLFCLSWLHPYFNLTSTYAPTSKTTDSALDRSETGSSSTHSHVDMQLLR